MTTDLQNWRACSAPQLPATKGRLVAVEPFDAAKHGAGLFAALGGPGNADLWRYVPLGPVESEEQLTSMLNFVNDQQGWKTHVLCEANTGAPLGMASYMRIRPEAGSAEVGAIVFSKKLQRTIAATEAMFLMAKYLFEDLGYRRYEWKCNNANMASRRAALRLGFSFEGVFRQDMVVKGENRDTAWYSMIDGAWPAIKAGFEAWLAPENFDEAGAQRKTLEACRAS